MKTITYTEVKTKPKLEISYCDITDSPREWSNLGYFITCDRDYHSPDNDSHSKDIKSIIETTAELADSQERHIELIKAEIEEYENEKVLAIYPIVKYEHGGVSYSLGTVHGFDYSNNGFYIITDKTQKEVGTEQKDFEKVIEGELDNYNKYINGEVYQFCLYDESGEVEDSCGGFYDIEDIREYLPDIWKNEELKDYLVS